MGNPAVHRTVSARRLAMNTSADVDQVFLGVAKRAGTLMNAKETFTRAIQRKTAWIPGGAMFASVNWASAGCRQDAKTETSVSWESTTVTKTLSATIPMDHFNAGVRKNLREVAHTALVRFGKELTL